jgi:hypothetical protein
MVAPDGRVFPAVPGRIRAVTERSESLSSDRGMNAALAFLPHNFEARDIDSKHRAEVGRQ